MTEAELVLLDINSFTWKSILQWKSVLCNASRYAQHLWLVDTVIFSFKFGNTRTAYGCNNVHEYYEMMADYFWDVFNMKLHTVGEWDNASLLCFSKIDNQMDTKLINFDYVEYDRIYTRHSIGLRL